MQMNDNPLAETQPVITIRSPDAVIKSWVDNCKHIQEFWEEQRETYEGLNKTREEAINLCGYYAGRYDMAIKVRSMIAEKKVHD